MNVGYFNGSSTRSSEFHRILRDWRELLLTLGGMEILDS